jgi:uncharacterized membrane protein YfcA
MLEIILLYFLCKKNAALAEQKKASKRRWVLTTIFNWILGEVSGIFLLSYILMIAGHLDPEAVQPFGEMNKEMFFIMCAGLLGGYLGYLLTRKRLEDLSEADGTIE